MIRGEVRKNKDLFSIFPADAGVNLEEAGIKAIEKDIPRGCGGEPLLIGYILSTHKYSPRMRG